MTSQNHDAKYVDMVKDIVLSRVDRSKVAVFLFGSRARGDHAPRADVDVGFLAEKRLPPGVMHAIRNALDDSIVPLHVDLVDFSETEPRFREPAFQARRVWNKPTSLN
ncbi:nucleotidyltransferase family protein [Desulfonatronum thioautotrophicum]|uniref:nucleotidyltransferase family protein n=1 Tax=Desulfonatronum thioautotrophicum TaxID=617001 RepID=UPI0005EAFF02|nr:nucleotidyltransferase domain-containing protein [Desulfonatronum thioautotrophicum]